MQIKSLLYEFCVEFVEKRIATIQKAIAEAQIAANEETKSSVGDKYETGRAMAQIDKELNIRQLLEAEKLKSDLMKINLKAKPNSVQLGSLIKTNEINYFIAISAGKIVIDGINYFAVSPVSPIGAKLLNKSVGDTFEFNGKILIINEIE